MTNQTFINVVNNIIDNHLHNGTIRLDDLYSLRKEINEWIEVKENECGMEYRK